MSELLWVAVPNGLVREEQSWSEATIRVLVVPRLAEGTIADFALQDWPAVLNEEARFELRTRTSAGERVAARSPTLVQRARSEVWTGFFGGDAGIVNQFQPKTYPVPEVAPSYTDGRDAVRAYRTVRRAAANPANDAEEAVRTTIKTMAAGAPQAPVAPTGTPSFTIPDFHATTSFLREHPTVLDDLGLVFELIVDITDLRLGTARAGRQLAVRCVDPPFLAPLVKSPWTRYEVTAADFRPAAAPGSGSGIRMGMLDLGRSESLTSPATPGDPGRWALATFDVDVRDSLRQAARDLDANPQSAAVMPPVRSVGVALLRPDRRGDFEARMHSATTRANAPAGELVLGAEDLLLGYRVDIRRGDDKWRSVCERDVNYWIDGIPIGPARSDDEYLREEGHVKAFTAHKDAAGNLHTDEVVLTWDGWSLALLRPNLNGDTLGPVRAEVNQLPYRFDWDFSIPTGRLPALRFAAQYQMRVRIADITGSGVELDDVDTSETASVEVIYRRHEPVEPPQLRAEGDLATGAAIDRMVIRSDKGMTPEQLQSANPSYPAVETRVLAPPTAALRLVEQHRALDDLTDEKSFEHVRRALDTGPEANGLPDPVVNGVNATVPAEPGGLAEPRSERSPWAPAWPNPRPKTIEVRGHGNLPVPVTIKWEPRDTLKVTLGQGEQATIELSSTIREDREDHLAARDDFHSAPLIAEAFVAATMNGRNPIVTPPRRILVIHAVKRPLAEPLWNLPAAAVVRRPRDTGLVLNPTFTEVADGAGLNTDTTGRLVVAAAWTEVEDAGAEAASVKRPMAVSHLHSQSIARGAPPAMHVRHEFGDTKHRVVTYTLQATTRFREYFKESDPEADFRRTRQQAPVTVLSSARPSAPVVLGVVPAFRWERTQGGDRIEHHRKSQRLRVELARPWFETGTGEQLAVVLAADEALPATDLVTRIGRDPLFATAATPSRPPAAWFPTAPVNGVSLPELNTSVRVVPVDVVPAGDRWSADVELAVPAAARSYNPFVQLAVARYQRSSLQGLELSPVVPTDRVPLLPDRSVVITRSGSRLDVSVDGTSPSPLNRLEVILEACGRGIEPTSLDAVVEDAAAEPGLPAWRPVLGGTVVRTPAGSIPPLPLAATAGRLRVRVRETEDLPGGDGGPADLVRRSVFVDTIVLPQAWHPA